MNPREDQELPDPELSAGVHFTMLSLLPFAREM